MKKFIWIIAISALLESIISCFIPMKTDYFHILFTLVSLLLLAPYFFKNNNYYYKMAFITGLLYDIAFTNTIFLNATLFLGLAILSYLIYQIISVNLFNSIITTCLFIGLYRIVTFFILLLIGYTKFDMSILFNSITSSLILNILYAIPIFYMVRYLAKKAKIIKFY